MDSNFTLFTVVEGPITVWIEGGITINISKTCFGETKAPLRDFALSAYSATVTDVTLVNGDPNEQPVEIISYDPDKKDLTIRIIRRE